MTIVVGWWVIPMILSVFFIFKSWPREDKYTSGNFSHFEIDNFIRLFWLAPVGLVWAVYFAAKLYL